MARQFKPKPKERRMVPIPSELRESLQEVFELIEQSKYDPDVEIGYDDAIQVGAVCGGCYGVDPRPYMLTYFPTGDEQRGRWELALHETEIEDIGDGVMKEILMYCCTSPKCRAKSRVEESCDFCDYEEDKETLKVKKRLETLAKKVKTKEEWIRGYLKIKPEATAASVIADYNPIEGLGERLGWFSFPEVDELLKKCREEG